MNDGNGELTVLQREMLLGVAMMLREWKPPHKCQQILRRLFATELGVLISVDLAWTKPQIKGLKRIEHFEVHAKYDPSETIDLGAELDTKVEEIISTIVERDVRFLLSRTSKLDTQHIRAQQLRDAVYQHPEPETLGPACQA